MESGGGFKAATRGIQRPRPCWPKRSRTCARISPATAELAGGSGAGRSPLPGRSSGGSSAAEAGFSISPLRHGRPSRKGCGRNGRYLYSDYWPALGEFHERLYPAVGCALRTIRAGARCAVRTLLFALTPVEKQVKGGTFFPENRLNRATKKYVPARLDPVAPSGRCCHSLCFYLYALYLVAC